MDNKLHLDSLSALLGQFTPNTLGSRLFMERIDVGTPENFLVWFHERFHYLQVVFTPYGHLKWGSYRTFSSDIVETWTNLSTSLKQPKRIPIREYLLNDTSDSVKLAYNIWIHDLKNEIYKIVEKGATTYNNMALFNNLDHSSCCPMITILGKEYRLRGIDILESFAKFEEAMLGELIAGRSLDDTINPDRLYPEYYSALYYFIETLGVERLIEFPIVCELSLATAHIPSPSSLDDFHRYAPNWRFVKIIEVLKELKDLPVIDFNCSDSFYDYSNIVLRSCGYETIDEAWLSAEEYANTSDLTMAKEMKAAIEYKKHHPWMLAYPMCNESEFLSDAFNRFEPYFTIMADGVSYNSSYIRSEELLFEIHLQALAQQICGYISKYCHDSFKLMCGYSYFGLNTCQHYLNGECDGHIDRETKLPDLVLDEHSNLVCGCTFDMCMKLNNININEIDIGDMKIVTYSEITDAAKKHFANSQ